MILNEEQAQAVSHYEGTCVVTACPGSGKCITGDSWVFSDSCLLSTIKENDVSSVLGLSGEKLSTVNIEIKRVGKFVDSGIKPVVRITTHHGFSICGTEHHPIVILNKEGNLVWRHLSDIRVGDFAAIWCNKNCESHAVADGMGPNYSRGLNPSKMDYSYYLMGLLLGDGSLSIPKCISFCCQSELKSSFLFLIKAIYGERVSEYRDKRREELWNLYVYNKVKKKIVDQFGDIEYGSCDKYLTPEMLSGDKYQIAALIRGLFDTDGYAGDKGCEITLCSENLINQLHLLLLHFGVFSHKKTKYVDGNPYYRIQIHGEDYRRFVRNIGFGVLYKRESSQRILNKISNPNKTIPYMQSVLKEFRSEIREFDWWNGRTSSVFSDRNSVCLSRYLAIGDNSRNLTETSALKIVDICEDHNFQSNNVSYLKGIAENLYFSQVTKTCACGAAEPVFDYEIPQSHNFIANGFINHNTRVLTSRVVNLITNNGVDPRSILCLTFTNKAANEMKERVTFSLLDSPNVDSSMVWISTFHRLCLAILRKHGHLLGLPPNFTIYSSKDQEDLIAKVARMNDYEDISKIIVKKLAKAVNDFREDMLDFKQCSQELDSVESQIVKEYLEVLDGFHAIDFSGMLYKAWLLLKKYPEVSASLTKRFQYVLVDEMQDTNRIQYDIIRRIASHQNLFVVGDAQQSIFGFRGAKPENLDRMKTNFENTSEIILHRNYRSTAQILAVAEALIHNNHDAHSVKLVSDRGNGSNPCIVPCQNPEEEASRVVYKISQMKNQFGYKWHDFAVLYRLNSMSRSLEMALRSNDIPYRIVGGFSFFDRTEIKTTLSYLSLLTNGSDTIAFARAIKSPRRGIGDSVIGKLERIVQESGMPILDICNTAEHLPKVPVKSKANLLKFVKVIKKYREQLKTGKNLSEVADGLIRDSGYYQMLELSAASDYKANQPRLENVQEMVVGLEEFENQNPQSRMEDYLQSIQLLSNLHDQEEDDAVVLLTMHSAKGLEWPCVFIVGVEQGSVPHYRAVQEGSIEEERRLLYVGISRAKSFLQISYCQYRGNFANSKKGSRTIVCEPSMFINEMQIPL